MLSRSPDQAVEHRGVTVMVTRTGLDSFPPQSVATTESTWDRDSEADSGTVFLITPAGDTENGWLGAVMA